MKRSSAVAGASFWRAPCDARAVRWRQPVAVGHYPYLHLAPVLEDCTNCITPPLVLVVFYPGEVDVDGQLLFLGVRPSGYYRTRDLI